MKKLIVLIISFINFAHAGLYFSGGLGMTHNNDELHTSNTDFLNGGEIQNTVAFNMGYEPVSNTKVGGGYFMDFGLNFPMGDNVIKQSDSTEIKTDYEFIARLGSTFQATQRTYPYVFVAGVYDMGVSSKSSSLTTKNTQDIFGYGYGIGIRAFAGQNGFYDFNYLYHTAEEESLGTYSDGSSAKFTLSRGVFIAAIGYMF